jgi:phytoene dehydrogenase-like protein
MQQNEKLDHRHFYYIYNHGVGGRDLFRVVNNYEYFLNLYEKYIEPVAGTYAKLFNSYAQAYNKWNESRGSLFERPFKRKQVENIQYMKRLIIYIHQNPVHHGFCEHPVHPVK